MPRFEPFPGLRYDRARVELAAVTAPPYDVIDAHQRQALAERDPHNVVRVDVPVDDGSGQDPYARAAATLSVWEDEGVLVTDATPCFTRYRMTFTDEAGRTRRTLGVIGALELQAPGEGDVLPHERTTQKAKSDRLALLQATAANLSPIWGLSMAPGLSAAIAADGPPDAEWVDDAGVTHECWRVDDAEDCARIAALAGSAPVVVADGHHRYATSLVYRDQRRPAGGGSGPYDLTLALLVELTPEQLVVQPIHRLLTDFGSLEELTATLERSFTLHPAGPVPAGVLERMAADGALALVGPGGATTLLVPRPDAAGPGDNGAASATAALDSALLERALADLPHTVQYQHGLSATLARLEGGEAQAAVLLRPVPVPVIEAMARARALMPPKSTFFAPKPATGVVLRRL